MRSSSVTKARAGPGPVTEVQRSYDEGVTDEFIEPIVLEGRPRIAKDDSVILFNFRPDRMQAVDAEASGLRIRS